MIVYSWLYVLYDRSVPKIIRDTIKILIGILSPRIPVEVVGVPKNNPAFQAGVWGAFITQFFCLGITSFLSYRNGTFIWSGETNIINFLDDKYNIFLYGIVCPLYVGLGISLICLTIGSVKYEDEFIKHSRELCKTRFHILFPIAIIIILLISGSAIYNYVDDVMDSVNVEELYWFHKLLDSGDRVIGPMAVYYSILNFCLLLVSMSTIACFLVSFSSVLYCGEMLGKKIDLKVKDFEEIRNNLSYFGKIYVIAKLLSCAYIINFYIWAKSPLGNTSNLFITQVAITIIGIFIVSIPRYFIEYQWYIYRWRLGGFEDNSHQDIRTRNEKLIAHGCDVLLVSGFFSTVWLTPYVNDIFD